MTRRGDVLELAVLGLLHETSLHGYELRKQLTGVLGWGRALSYGTLYPRLKDLVRAGYIAQDAPAEGARGGRRSRISYKLTADGKDRFAELVAQAGPAAWEDEDFDVHFAFFARTDAATRLRILEGRRGRLQERLDQFRASAQRTRARRDAYTLELQRHGLESVESEVRWLDGVISSERSLRTERDRSVPPADPR